jgi:SET domain-containing protein
MLDAEKGCGIKATRKFCKGEFVMEYKGEVISTQEGLKREKKYQKSRKGDNLLCKDKEKI